jgi:hypothetical protein
VANQKEAFTDATATKTNPAALQLWPNDQTKILQQMQALPKPRAAFKKES